MPVLKWSVLVLTASSKRNLGKDEELELQYWRVKIIIIESNMGEGRHGSSVPEGQKRVRAQQKELSFWKRIQFIWTGRSCCLFLRGMIQTGSLCKLKGLKGIFCLFKMKYFQRLNWKFFTYFWRWGEFFFFKIYKNSPTLCEKWFM